MGSIDRASDRRALGHECVVFRPIDVKRPLGTRAKGARVGNAALAQRVRRVGIKVTGRPVYFRVLLAAQDRCPQNDAFVQTVSVASGTMPFRSTSRSPPSPLPRSMTRS